MRVKMIQHAVGQGGLFSGELAVGSKPLRWAYDCGSNQRDLLSRGIAKIGKSGALDLLFLSHLDSDHMNGIDMLLSRVGAREVVLPYLNETLLVTTIARDAARGTLSGMFVEAASDLAGWFGRRGVETIIFVNGTDDDGGGIDGPRIRGGPDDRFSEGPVKYDWSRDPVDASELDRSTDQAQMVQGNVARVQAVAADAVVELFVPGVMLNWALIPYVHAPSFKRMKAFEAALESEFGSPLDKKAIVAAMKSSTDLARLRDCYDALWKDHNLITMTLYSGPLNNSGARVWVTPQRLRNHWWEHHSGWMLTGDAHLNVPQRRTRFLKYYRQFMPFISVFMLPHHGSIHNHSSEVLDAMPELRIGYAAAGPNGYGHPHSDVSDDVDGRPSARFHKVGRKARSELGVHIRFP
jgi:hypothetical protein